MTTASVIRMIGSTRLLDVTHVYPVENPRSFSEPIQFLVIRHEFDRGPEGTSHDRIARRQIQYAGRPDLAQPADHVIIERDGTAYLTLDLSIRGVGSMSQCALFVRLVGNIDQGEPTMAQQLALVRICVDVLKERPDVRIVIPSEIGGAPGLKYLDVESIRKVVRATVAGATTLDQQIENDRAFTKFLDRYPTQREAARVLWRRLQEAEAALKDLRGGLQAYLPILHGLTTTTNELSRRIDLEIGRDPTGGTE